MWKISLLDCKLWIICTILWSFVISTISTSCPFGPYGNCKFVPAPPGKTPVCARPGQTYCEEVQDYPKYLIKSLLDKWCYDFNTLFLSETPIDFNGNVIHTPTSPHHIQPVYGPPNHVPPNLIGQYPEPIYIPKPTYVTNEIGNTYLPPSPHAVSNYSEHQQNFHQAATLNNNIVPYSANTNYYPQNYYQNSIPYNPYNNQQQLASLISREFWARLVHQRAKRSPFKEKQPYKFVPKTETFKEFITHKEPRKIDHSRNLTDLHREKRHFLSIVNNVGSVDKTKTRVKRQFNQQQLCNVDTSFVKPKTAMNTNGNWKYVVNLDDSPQYEQYVQKVECLSARSQCNQLCSLPEGYTSSCEQRFVQKRLVSLAENGQTLESDRFWLPSCCECVIVRV